mmetsp:Transcript_26759/g.61589  ORF Transcript_26759/g.61589 Transcript_26759/m.61589 type:complete len:528 (+) Transcript_26759:681-2264(+)
MHRAESVEVQEVLGDRRHLPRQEIGAAVDEVSAVGVLPDVGLSGSLGAGGGDGEDLEEDAHRLLVQHGVVPLHGGVLEVGPNELRQTGGDQESVTAAALAGFLEAVGGQAGAEGFEAGGGGVEVGDALLGDGVRGRSPSFGLTQERGFGVAKAVQDPPSREAQGVGGGQEREKRLLLRQVIHDLALFVSVAHESLAPHAGVADGDGDSPRQVLAALVGDVGADVHHGDVMDAPGGLGHLRRHVLPGSGEDFGEPRGHVSAGHAHFVETGEAVVHIVVPDFGTDVPHGHAREGKVGLRIAEGHEKVVDPPVDPLPVHQLRDNHGAVGRAAQRPRPELRSGQRRGVQDELVRLFVVRGGGLQGAHVGPVSQLRLGVASDHLQVFAPREPVFTLLLVAKGLDVRDEHDPVQSRGQIVAHGVHEPLKLHLVLHLQAAREVRQTHHPSQGADVTGITVHVRIGSVVKDAGGIGQDGRLDEATTGGEVGAASVEEIRHEGRVETGAGAFPDEVGVGVRGVVAGKRRRHGRACR